MTLTPGTCLGPYEILSLRGSGGMGEVYRARDTRLNRTVALKVLPPDVTTRRDRRERFGREARAVAALNHPHICALYDFGRDDEIEYLVMEYLEGQTLAERLITGPLAVDDVLQYAVQIADALDHAHRQGLVHRDLKPANVMVTKSGAKLLDFGLAKSSSHAAVVSGVNTETENLTADLTVLGTLRYMSPEQLEGRKVDARSDIFAFGAVVFEMATGRKAFEGGSPAGVIAATLSTDPPSMRAVCPLLPAALDRVTRKCLAKDPDERWQSAHDLRTELEWIAQAPLSEDPRAAAAAANAKRRERLAWITTGLLLVIGVVAIGFTRRAGHDTTGETRPIRFLIAPPEDTTLFSGGGVMAVSPDGRHLAFVATPKGAKPLLWMRSLDTTIARPLAGTTDASQPFWSPDNRFVAFFAEGKLKKVDAASGQVQTLCESRGHAGTWNVHGDILFRSEDVSSGIAHVPASGGPVTAVTSPDRSRGEFSHSWPQFLPDGRRFLYLVWSTKPEFAGVYVASLGGADRTRVLSDRSQALYVPQGYLVFRRESTVLAQRFDASTLKLSGDPVPLANEVAFNGRTARGVFSLSNNGVLAYRTAEDTVLAWFDRKGAALGTLGLAGLDRDPALSPDGKTLAVARLDPRTGTTSIWLIDADRGTATRFSFDPHGDSAPTWSPDGRRIAFASQRGGRSEVYVKSSGGGTSEELLLSEARPVAPTDWSRDGRFVIFQSLGLATKTDIWALPLGIHPKPFALVETPDSELQGSLSPDGRWLAYVSAETGTYEVYVRPFRASTTKKRISNQGGVEPKWAGDGRALYYLGGDQRLMSVTIRTTLDFEVDPPVPLFETRAVAPVGSSLGITGRNQYDVAPDGRFLVNAPGPGSSKPITVVIDWPATLNR
jgi:Tol biopolymer transport system component/tRNA A-37 threonylcarbamoyl transferase component Bud32